jgi:hypothetical protein
MIEVIVPAGRIKRTEQLSPGLVEACQNRLIGQPGHKITKSDRPLRRLPAPG